MSCARFGGCALGGFWRLYRGHGGFGGVGGGWVCRGSVTLGELEDKVDG